MPVYEYRCQSCQRRSSVFLRSFSQQVEPCCPHCGSRTLTRLPSTFVVGRSWGQSLENVPSFEDVDEGDPRSMARWMKRMRAEIGEDLGPEFDEAVSRLEAGEMPEELEEEESEPSPED